MEHTPKVHAELEVTGVSRSGRVCKKSSKLVDFQSPDDLSDAKQKKAQKLKTPNTSGSGLEYLADVIKAEHDSDAALDDNEMISDSEDDGSDSPMDSDDDDVMDIEDMEGTQEEDEKSDSELLVELAPKRSLYMSEKSSKFKKMLKDGKVVTGKTQRKDKGKRRFTAYMLWAKEARKQMLSNPDLDFGSISKRLGEMWTNVPSNQKHNWKRRAKRIANKFKQGNEKALDAPFVKRYLHLEQSGSSPTVGVTTSGTPTTMTSTPNAAVSRGKKAQQKGTPLTIDSKSTVVTSAHLSPDSPTKGSGHMKLPGCQPTDVAAHLKLLGDSLTIIGERLKEHEGQIAVSGSLSVLLDSLLCSLGPLMCLTVHIPGLQADAEHLKDVFQNTLDNIAYVMPGL
ncbi:HMG box-containing protein 4 [Topomyia yanbarensis]|uniref:HMG box-containing protein 4 n=1 Tax=Topomyia yanbarensis TaxID=2498891 RepID=UPI00273CBCA1|nr:HMG box-containing protein 4 [Topomyia yanbarensis]